MPRALPCLLVILLATTAHPASAQLLADTVFTWQGYTRTATCHLRIYKTAPGEERTHTVVIGERAESDGPSTTSDARHLVELIGRQFDVNPDQAYWIFHWGRSTCNQGQTTTDKTSQNIRKSKIISTYLFFSTLVWRIFVVTL